MPNTGNADHGFGEIAIRGYAQGVHCLSRKENDMLRIILPTVFAALLGQSAIAQQAEPDPTPPPPAPDAQAAPDAQMPAPLPLPVQPTRGSNCGGARQLNS